MYFSSEKEKIQQTKKNNTKEIRVEVIRARELPLPVTRTMHHVGCTESVVSHLVSFSPSSILFLSHAPSASWLFPRV
jgi:hypothetical protein